MCDYGASIPTSPVTSVTLRFPGHTPPLYTARATRVGPPAYARAALSVRERERTATRSGNDEVHVLRVAVLAVAVLGRVAGRSYAGAKTHILLCPSGAHLGVLRPSK